MFLGVLLVGEEQPQGVAVDDTPAVVVVALGVVVVVVAFNSCSCSSLFMINKK